MRRNKLKISTRAIRVIGTCVCVIFSLVFLCSAGFNYFSYSDARRKFKQNQVCLVRLEQDAQNLKQHLLSYKEERQRFGKLLFSDRDIATFLEEFGKFASKAKVKIADMKVQKFQDVKPQEEVAAGSARVKRTVPTKKKQEEGFSLCSMPIRVVAQGNFEHIVDFLLFLERYRQFLTLSNVNIRRRVYPQLECTFVLRLYSLKRLEELKNQ